MGLVEGHVNVLCVGFLDDYKNNQLRRWLLTLFATHHDVFQEIYIYALVRRQDRTDVDREELVHLVLGSELSGEHGCRDSTGLPIGLICFHNKIYNLIDY